MMLLETIRFLVYDKYKMFGILGGILISVFLIGEQLSIYFSMMGGMKGMAEKHKEKVWVISSSTQNSLQLRPLDVRVVHELASIPGVSAISPFVMGGGSTRYDNGMRTSVNVFGLSGPHYLGAPTMEGRWDPTILGSDGAVIVDASDKASTGLFEIGGTFLLNDKRVRIAGFSKGNTGFGASNMVTTIERARVLTGTSPNSASAVLLEVNENITTKQRVVEAINSTIPHIRAMTGEQFGDMTMTFMMKTSNVAMSFKIMVAIALLSGICVVGLMMFSAVNDRIRDYGTIKAIGGSNGLIARLILQQGAIHAIIGFTLALLIVWGFSLFMAGGRMQVKVTWELIGYMAICTVIISAAGCLLGLRKIIKLEPAAIYRM
jgi:putative ABC transport system permease protein